ncbi:OsmC family protein [Nodosilinea nodulosa]|uniref:OsmC family protein n=1 Tax=Nodosilinea nodulosa TaxID=416001 RepID=UPI00031CF087|nr:OsmC family protein [Nodosilinea nodulosa]
MASVQVSSNGSRYGQDVALRQFQLAVDEPASVGGDDRGPTPTELLLAALGSCKAITIKMYAERKKWPLENVFVAVDSHPADRPTTEGQSEIKAYVTLVGDLTDEQRNRLREIGDRCPVHRLISAGANIHTVLTHPDDHGTGEG